MPRCKNCKETYEQYEFNNKFCLELDCQTQKALFKLRKIKKQEQVEWKQRKKEGKENLKTWEDYFQATLKVFNTFIRERDKKNPCISCDKPAGQYKLTSGHFHPQGTYRSIALDEDNAHGQCWFNCNKNKHGNITEYRPRLIQKIGVERVEDLDARRNVLNKYSIPELIILKQEYKEKTRILKQQEN